jgi:hypothetical protein
MALTQTDLINEAYAEVTLSRSPPPADDAAVIAARLAARLADVRSRTGVVIDTADIDPASFPHLVAIVAEDIAPKFGGRPANPQVSHAAETFLKAQLRENTLQPVKALYF